MSDAHDPGFDHLRDLAQADGAQAVTEAENRDQVGWNMHVQGHEANVRAALAAAAVDAQRAHVRSAIADAIQVATWVGTAIAVKGILRGWKRVL